jgi:glycosyltransferase involved in cell wall biosynthesis
MVIVGSGTPEDVAAFREQSRRLGLEHRCLWKGFVTEDEKVRAYAQARFYCLPSYTENFGNTVQEALGVGTPVLTTTGTPWLELEKMGCGWVAECDVPSLTAKLACALALPTPALQAMGVRGRDYIKSGFSLDAVIDKQIRTYRWLLGGERPEDIWYV